MKIVKQLTIYERTNTNTIWNIIYENEGFSLKFLDLFSELEIFSLFRAAVIMIQCMNTASRLELQTNIREDYVKVYNHGEGP